MCWKKGIWANRNCKENALLNCLIPKINCAQKTHQVSCIAFSTEKLRAILKQFFSYHHFHLSAHPRTFQNQSVDQHLLLSKICISNTPQKFIFHSIVDWQREERSIFSVKTLSNRNTWVSTKLLYINTYRLHHAFYSCSYWIYFS